MAAPMYPELSLALITAHMISLDPPSGIERTTHLCPAPPPAACKSTPVFCFGCCATATAILPDQPHNRDQRDAVQTVVKVDLMETS